MEIDISGGGWRQRASAFDGGNGRRWALGFDGRWQWTAVVAAVDNRYGIQWWQWRWRLMMAAAFDGVRWCWR
jgi:hypothetical protein